MMHRQSRIRSAVGVVVTLALVALTVPAADADDELTLRMNDAAAAPGGIVALVVRTYESRPLGQGQACFVLNSFIADPLAPAERSAGAPAEAGNPFSDYLGSIVFSGEEDARHRLTLGPGGDLQFLVEFMSPSATINDSDGPMVVHYLKLSPDAQPGDRYDLGLEPADTWLIDDAGAPVPLEIRNSELTVRAAGAPLSIEADGDEVSPGRLAEVSLQTVQVLRMAEGEVTLVYDPAIAADEPMVVIAPKVGDAEFTVDNSVPGRTVVAFRSVGATLNRLPGDLIQFLVPTRADVPLGTRSPVSFDPASTILDRDGNPIPLVFEADVIEFTND